MSDSNEYSEEQSYDGTGDPVAKDGGEAPEPEPVGPQVGPDGRVIVVPKRLFKVVTVFSTLLAVVTYLIGFVLIDAATLQVSIVRRLIGFLLGSVGIGVPEDVLTAALAILGVSFILAGTAAYVLGTRFQAQGMRKSQEDSSEEYSND